MAVDIAASQLWIDREYVGAQVDGWFDCHHIPMPEVNAPQRSTHTSHFLLAKRGPLLHCSEEKTGDT